MILQDQASFPPASANALRVFREEAFVEDMGFGRGGHTVRLPEDPLAQAVLAQCLVPEAEASVALHQQPVAVLVTAILLQNFVADPDSLLGLVVLHVVD